MTSQSTSPLITIVLPVRNRGEIVGRTLASIASQTYRPLEVVLVDNGSTDNTAEVLEAWRDRNNAPDFKVKVVSEPAKGASNARNRGLKEVETPYVMFFDSDDTMLPDHVSRVAKSLQKYPETDLIYWDVTIIDPDGWSKLKSMRGDSLVRSHILHGTLSTLRMAVRTQLIRESGWWDKSLAQWDDLELGLRLVLKASHPFYLTGESTVHIYPQPDSLTGADYSSVAPKLVLALDAMSNDIDRLENDADRRRALHLLVDMRRADLAGHLSREGRKLLSDNIMSEILPAAPTTRDAFILRLAYLTVKLFGRGAYVGEPWLSSRIKKPSEVSEAHN